MRGSHRDRNRRILDELRQAPEFRKIENFVLKLQRGEAPDEEEEKLLHSIVTQGMQATITRIISRTKSGRQEGEEVWMLLTARIIRALANIEPREYSHDEEDNLIGKSRSRKSN